MPITAERAAAEVTTVVCFPFADLPSIRTAEGELAGDHIHLVPGIDRDLEGLVVHLLHDAPTVLVVVHSKALEPARLEAVLATFATQRTRNHRLCVVEYDAADCERFLHAVEVAVDETRERLGLPPGPVAAARRVSRARREAEPGEGSPERSEEFAVPSFELTTTSPGAEESGTTFPDLTASAEHVRRGRVVRAERDRSRRITWAGVAAVSAIAAAVWTLQQRAPMSPDMVRSAAPVAPKRHAPERTPEPAPPPEPKIVTPSVPRAASSDAAAEARRVAAALDAGQVRALDALLVRAGSWQPESFGDARRRCAKLEVAELPGWRLATLEELRSLRRARLLPEGEYWSASWVGGQSVFTLDRDTTRPQERSKDDVEHARTLCVHERR